MTQPSDPTRGRSLPRLLVVDDEIAVCDILRHFFTKQGYEVFIATEGRQALVIAAREQPHMMLLDIKMPMMSGVEVLRQLQERKDPVKVVMVSAVHDDEVIAEARALGAVDFVVKPFHLDYLEQVVLKKLAALTGRSD